MMFRYRNGSPKRIEQVKEINLMSVRCNACKGARCGFNIYPKAFENAPATKIYGFVKANLRMLKSCPKGENNA